MSPLSPGDNAYPALLRNSIALSISSLSAIHNAIIVFF